MPTLYRELTTPRILVAELLEGITVLDYIRSLEAGSNTYDDHLARIGFDPEEFARNIIRNFVRDAFTDGLFHADLHPANLIIQPDSAVGYVDFGITGSLSRYARRSLVALTLALTRADADQMMVHFLRLSPTDDDSDVPAFRRGLDDALDRWYDLDRDEPEMIENYTRVMLDFLRLSRETGVWPTPDVIRYIRSVITADGLDPLRAAARRGPLPAVGLRGHARARAVAGDVLGGTACLRNRRGGTDRDHPARHRSHDAAAASGIGSRGRGRFERSRHVRFFTDLALRAGGARRSAGDAAARRTARNRLESFHGGACDGDRRCYNGLGPTWVSELIGGRRCGI